jgi:hypothetical protein
VEERVSCTDVYGVCCEHSQSTAVRIHLKAI